MIALSLSPFLVHAGLRRVFCSAGLLLASAACLEAAFTSESVSTFPTPAAGARATLIDHDGDGDADILYQTGANGTAFQYARSNGDGTYTILALASSPFAGLTLPDHSGTNYYTADFDGDGDYDVWAGVNGTTGSYFRRDGASYTSQPSATFPAPGAASRCAVADFDGDGDADIIYQTGANGTAFQYARSNGDGTFTILAQSASPFTGLTLPNNTGKTHYAADFDRDGDIDLWAGANSTTGSYFRNDGSSFSAQSSATFPAPAAASRALTGDFDADGDVDILYQTGANGTAFQYARGNGDGTFTIVALASSPFAGLTIPDNTGLGSHFAGDVDGDGDTDVRVGVNSSQGSYFKHAGSPPRLTSSNPADNATGVSPTANIVLTFDQSVVKGSAGNIVIRRVSDNVAVATIAVTSGSVSGSGTTWTVASGTTLASLTNHYVQISSGAFVNGSGAVYAGITSATTLNFTTSQAVPVINSTLTAGGTYGSTISTYTITATNSPTSYSASGLPSGLSVNTGNGQITGIPTTNGTFNVTIGATNGGGTGSATLVFTIAKKNLTVSGVVANNKTYDAGVAATLNFGSASLVGVVGGDTVNINSGSASGAFSNATVGTGKTVTVSGLGLSGVSSGNYTLTQPTLSANITAAGLTVTGLTANNKTYDAGTGATLSGTAALAGVIGGDTVSLTGTASGAFTTPVVGTGKSVTVSGLSLTGEQAGNYTLTQPTLSADITAVGLTVTGLTANNKTYDAGTGATLSGTAALSGVIGGDTVSLTGTASGAFTTPVVGTGKSVTVFGLSLTGAQAGNYTLTQPTLSADITAAGLTVTGFTANNKPYDTGTGATLNLVGATLVGVFGGDAVTLNTASALGVFDNATVGDGKTVTVSGLTLDGPVAGNYTLTQPTATANITAVQLTVTADEKIRPYGYANPVLTSTITGFVGGETSAVLSGAPALSTGASAGSPLGAYTISAAIGSLAATNYTFTFADGTLTVRGLDITDWEEANFTPSELLDENISGPNADPDLDGVTNLYEYAFGTDPNDIASGPDALVYAGTFAGGGSLEETGQPLTRTETTPVNNTRLLLIRRKPAFTTDLTYTVQFSHNGTAWVTSAVVPTVLAESGLYQVVSVPYPSLTSGKRTRFHRIVAEVVE